MAVATQAAHAVSAVPQCMHVEEPITWRQRAQRMHACNGSESGPHLGRMAAADCSAHWKSCARSGVVHTRTGRGGSSDTGLGTEVLMLLKLPDQAATALRPRRSTEGGHVLMQMSLPAGLPARMQDNAS